MQIRRAPNLAEKKETVLAYTPPPEAPTGWEMVLSGAPAGKNILPVPFAYPELGYVLQGRVQLTELPPDFDPETVKEEARVEVLGPGDAFSIAKGERIMIEVLEDLVFLLVRPATKAPDTPSDCCV
ncbi:MAG: hypothetical protein Kow00129_12960 [Thermoleophilia bacterium]